MLAERAAPTQHPISEFELLGRLLRVSDSEDGSSFREGVVAAVSSSGGSVRIRMRVDRRVVRSRDQFEFESLWDFEHGEPQNRVELAWGNLPLSPRPAFGAIGEPGV